MNAINKTMYIPLYGKAFVSRMGLFLSDKKAEEIWESEGFKLKRKSKSKWLAYYMGIRAAVFDEWIKEKCRENNGATVIHLGCGLDSRVLRVKDYSGVWYDVDFPEVIEERKLHYKESDEYKMIGCNIKDTSLSSVIPRGDEAIVILEGVSMYLPPEELRGIYSDLSSHFSRLYLLVDCYSVRAARLSKYKNPTNEVGVREFYGIDDPEEFNVGGLKFKSEHTMTPKKYIDELSGFQHFIFKNLYAGSLSKKLYRLFEYEKI